MEISVLGNENARDVLLLPLDERDMDKAERLAELIARDTQGDFRLMAFGIGDWNRDLSPWKAPAAFGGKDFGGGSALILDEIMKHCKDRMREYYIGGYSLAGLFALWAAYQTDIFRGVAAASPSIWFPGFVEYMKEGKIRCDQVYLSLGDREEKTKNPVTSTVGDRIREAYQLLKEQDAVCTLEWNEGNHFRDVEERTARAF